ncbi:hypothetical protein GCM10011356_01330 [Kangiella profundi]|nr:hypothetical protein GCM10011356_01330 [Kangiella profundi]
MSSSASNNFGIANLTYWRVWILARKNKESVKFGQWLLHKLYAKTVINSNF